MVEVEVQLLFWVGGWSDKMKLILIPTYVEVVAEVELGNPCMSSATSVRESY